ncbi:protein of unknown function [Blastococcus saxobsidens DD2]|uniref:N-acetyltransferase domain-containing protein n=1 Tax=Blastococcus saxobsidens (strain DD2) TaxID=1146883 RepID=H6RRZ4_BLASD|nr:protein of unknown function [Blastococcus saxobsidens DD2]
MIVRRERPEDHAAVQALHRAAFATDPVTGAVRAADDVPEVRLVDRLRGDPGFLPHLSLVAVDEGDVVGHGIATRGWLEPFGTPVLGLGPLGVRPDRQGCRVGAAPTGEGSAAAAHLALADRHLAPARERAAGDGHPRATERAHPAAQRVHLGGAEVPRQLHDVGAQLLQRHLALVVADDDVVDGGLADDPGDLLLLLRDQATDPAGHSFADEDDPRPAQHPVHRVHLRGAGHARADPPVPAHALEHPRGRPRLALHLPVGRALGPAAEDDQRGQGAEEHRQRDEHERRAEQDADELDDGGDRDEPDQHDPRELGIVLPRQGVGLLDHASLAAELADPADLGLPVLVQLGCLAGLAGRRRGLAGGGGPGRGGTGSPAAPTVLRGAPGAAARGGGVRGPAACHVPRIGAVDGAASDAPGGVAVISPGG